MQVLGKADLSQLLKWRMKILRECLDKIGFCLLIKLTTFVLWATWGLNSIRKARKEGKGVGEEVQRRSHHVGPGSFANDGHDIMTSQHSCNWEALQAKAKVQAAQVGFVRCKLDTNWMQIGRPMADHDADQVLTCCVAAVFLAKAAAKKAVDSVKLSLQNCWRSLNLLQKQ